MAKPLDLERDEDRLIWIFGSSRSGSTWLLRMLSELREVVPVDDPHLGHHLGVWRPIPLAWAASSAPPELQTLLDLKAERPGYLFAESHRDAWWDPLKGLVRARFESAARAHVGEEDLEPAVVVKEPGSQVAGLLMELFGRSRMIFLLRDGRDVVDSWLAAHRHGTWAIREGAFPVAPWGRMALVRWLSSVWVYRTEEVRKAFAAHDPKLRTLVRYEDLRADTAAELTRICAGAGLDRDPVALPDIAERHSFERVPPTRRGGEHEIRLASPGAWQENMSEAEQAAMHSIMGTTLAELSYLTPETASAIPA